MEENALNKQLRNGFICGINSKDTARKYIRYQYF